jgi:L-lactate utilization protein LutB
MEKQIKKIKDGLWHYRGHSIRHDCDLAGIFYRITKAGMTFHWCRNLDEAVEYIDKSYSDLEQDYISKRLDAERWAGTR